MQNDLYDKWDQILDGYTECRMKDSDALNFVDDFEDVQGPFGPERVAIDHENYATEADEDQRAVKEENAFLILKAFRQLIGFKCVILLIGGYPIVIPVRYDIAL